MSMAGYQSFPGRTGDSNSFQKLASLALPPLVGKSFLDLGCNEGYFCGYALFEGASRIVGIDKSAPFLSQARKRFPQADFREGSWERLDVVLKPSEKFDVILCASAIHYAENQPGALAHFMERLRPNGVLILEMGVMADTSQADPGKNGWHLVKRAMDERLFPDWRAIRAMLAPYAWKHLGSSVSQSGDPIGREVFHVRNKLPLAVLLLDGPGTGKSTIARELAKALPVVTGDVIIHGNARIFSQILQENCDGQNIARIVDKLFAAGGASAYAELVAAQAGVGGFIYDGFVPQEYRQAFMNEFARLNYLPILVSLPTPDIPLSQLAAQARQEARKYQIFLTALQGARHTD